MLVIGSKEQFSSAFLASAAASSDLVHHIIPPTLQGSPIPHVDVANAQWSDGVSTAPPEGETRCSQKVWDTIKATAMADHLLSDVSDPRSRARLLEGAWCLAECAAHFLSWSAHG